MTVRKTKIKKKITRKRKSNPEWIDKILGRARTERDSVNITVTDGTLILKGKTLSTSFPELNEILETKLANFKIEFQPVGSSRKYILNRPKSSEKEESSERSPSDRVEEMRRLARRVR
mgnify:CR=1 FL=1